MSHNRGRHINEHLLSTNLVRPNVLRDYASNAVKAATLAPVDERRRQLPDQNIFIVRQRAAWLEQPCESFENIFDLGGGKIVQRQTRDDEVIVRLSFQLFDCGMNDT